MVIGIVRTLKTPVSAQNIARHNGLRDMELSHYLQIWPPGCATISHALVANLATR